uniref:Uncharacterized protein n=1 Tax=Arundo donax TaxID=35708 RepID=A0A0A8Z5Y8_ARUDO
MYKVAALTCRVNSLFFLLINDTQLSCAFEEKKVAALRPNASMCQRTV